MGRIEQQPVPQTAFEVRRNAQSAVERYEAISRQRSLTDAEISSFTHALKREARKNGETAMGQRPWTRPVIRQLRKYLIEGKRPAEIALLMHRTERAIWRKMCVLRWTVRDAAKGSIALPPLK